MKFMIPEALKDLCLSETYFSNGLVTIIDGPISLNNKKITPCVQNIHSLTKR